MTAIHKAIRAALHKADQELDLMPIEERERHDWGDYLTAAVVAVLKAAADAEEKHGRQ